MKLNRLIILPIAISLCWVGTLWAGAPLGAPGNQLEKGQWQMGAEFSFGEADWSAQGLCTETVVGVGSLSYQQGFQIEDLQSTAAFFQLAYGLTDDWDVFARLGGAQTETDFRVAGATLSTGNAGVTRLDSSYGFAGGLGTRATFYRKDAVSLGGVLQGTWFEPGDNQFSYPFAGPPSGTLVTNAKLSYFQVQLALAGLYQKDDWHAWIGPFLQHTQGDLDLEAQYDFSGVPTGTITCAADLDKRTRLGLNMGGGVRIKRCTYRLEGQFTGHSWLLGIGGTITVE